MGEIVRKEEDSTGYRCFFCGNFEPSYIPKFGILNFSKEITIEICEHCMERIVKKASDIINKKEN